MTTPENQEPAPAAEPAAAAADGRITRPEAARTAPNRKPMAGATDHEPLPPHGGVHDKDVLAVNEAVASSVRSAYDVLSDTIKQGRKAAEQFRGGNYNVRDVPDDVRQMAANLLGLARQLSSATFDICEALLRQTDGLMAPPPPGSTEVPAFHPAKMEPAAAPVPPVPPPAKAPAAHAAPNPAPKPTAHAATHPAHELSLSVQFNGKHTARAHTTTVTRPAAPTSANEIACDGLAALRGSGASPITQVAFEAHPSGQGLAVLVIVPHDQPSGIYAGSIYCNTQPLPLGQLVIEIE